MSQDVHANDLCGVSRSSGGASAPRLGLVVSILAVAVLGLTHGLAAGQANLTVAITSFPPEAGPGETVPLSFVVQNIGTSPTILTAITNYVFVLDQSGKPVTQLSPTASQVAHTWGSLAPGQQDFVGPISIVIPPDAPVDVPLQIAIFTDWVNLEVESNEMDNEFVWPVNVIGRRISLTSPAVCLSDVVDLPGFSDYFVFNGLAGAPIWSEVVAQRIGSTLDPKLNLVRIPNPFIAMEGHTPSLGLDARLDYASLQDNALYRLEVFGENGTTGTYNLCLERAWPEAEPNDVLGSATPMPIGAAMAGELGIPGDIDFYSFFGSRGDVLYLDVDSDQTLETPPDSTFDPMLIVRNAAGDTMYLDDDTDDYDPYLFFVLPQPGLYYIGVTDSPGGGLAGGYPGYNYMFKLSRLEGASLPDLTPTNIAPITPPVLAGDTVAVDFETRNTGGLATFAGGVSIDIWLSTDTSIDPLTDSLLAVGDFEGNVGAGSFVPTHVLAPIPPSMPSGGYFIGVVLDPTDTEVESAEGNNSGFIPISIQGPTGIGDQNGMPMAFALFQNYPNPVKGETRIAYHVAASPDGSPSSENVKIEIFNVLGQRLTTLVNRRIPSGIYSTEWNGMCDGRPVPSGVYFYRMEAGSFVQTKRLVILR